MRSAIGMARRGEGYTWPNPSVGCVIVQDGRVVARGRTAPGGRPHAEVQALAMAADQAPGATAYLTLEPCSHHGQTAPCADALIAAGVARVVVACSDPDPRVNGQGLARLRAANVQVETGLLAREATPTLAGFFTRIREGRPLVTLKIASTLDGRIATSTGESRWITGPEARRAGHLIRARHDAILVGIGTVRADDPALTCRIPGLRNPVRIVLDRTLRTPARARVLDDAAPTWLVHDGSAYRGDATLIEVPTVPGLAGGSLDLRAMMQALGARGLTSVLVEGGAAVSGALLRLGLVDRIMWFHAPAIMGNDGLAALRLSSGPMAELRRFTHVRHERLGNDMLTELHA